MATSSDADCDVRNENLKRLHSHIPEWAKTLVGIYTSALEYERHKQKHGSNCDGSL